MAFRKRNKIFNMDESLNTCMSKYGVIAEFHTDILTGNIQSVKQKLDSGVVDVNCVFKFSINGKNSYGAGSRLVRERLLSISSTPLHTACISKRFSLIKLLLDYGAQPNIQDSQQRIAALLILLYWPRIRPLSYLEGMTKEEKRYQLHIKRQHKIAAATLELLIERGTVITRPINDNGEYLTHIAARYNLIQALEILLQHNAPLDSQDPKGTTPLLLAANVGNFTIVQILIEQGANKYHTDHAGMGLLHFLAKSDHSSTCKYIDLFIKDFHKKDGTNEQGQTALHIACKHANEAAIHALIMNGLNPDELDHAGKSPLYELLNTKACLTAVYGLELLLQWTIHPKIYASDMTLPAWLDHSSMSSLQDKLLYLSDIPASLQRICKVCIRRCMGMRRLNVYDIKRLPCPIGLANIILYNTAEWWQ